jgi:hypothetical protein
LPQLIVGLDSLDESANYIHISDVKADVVYHCPCCKGIVKPRAYKKDEEYQVQPHFYHESGGCSEESFVHYICKTWLFENGCKFKIDNNLYTVSNIQTEKTLHTNFGDYRPDLIVDTDEGKLFFFEIKYSNKKTEYYIPKWDELETDVVEVDAREFINQKHNNDIPEFKLIYSDGYCFIKSYSHKDYEDTIAKRKIEWKRQDKLNYKIQWERLDWFWSELQKYKNGEVSEEDVFDYFKCLDIFDKEVCFDLLKRQSCIKKNNQTFRDIINKESIEYWNNNVFNMTKSGITFGICKIKPRKNISINYCYVDINGNKQHNYIWNDKREWILRPSELLKIIKDIKNDIFRRNEFTINQKLIEDVSLKVLKDVSKIFEAEDCIWYFTINAPGTFKIGIKENCSVSNFARDFITYHDFIDKKFDFTYENIYKIFINKITKAMKKIYENVLNYDGIGCKLRYVFASTKGGSLIE